ncbi:hypothetical protein ES288_D06G133400v1 [Gossypium darwinii]|uniref:Uncharacterized protein n=1 Tax=Gossypium darwinii TaxID=34276 RepID=A0A5D2C637_GOSDA|nr:hypothetical protein ES288_D06G133400v1 [Gossypium darwinii]
MTSLMKNSKKRFQSPDDSDKPISEINMKDLDSESLKPSWLERGEEIISSNIERKANSVDLPLSLRIMKRKLQWQEGFRDAGELTYCSLKKAFSSMVFIIQELHSYTLQMRELLFYENLQGVLVRVQKEMHASFVWLFQQLLLDFLSFSASSFSSIVRYSVVTDKVSMEVVEEFILEQLNLTKVTISEIKDNLETLLQEDIQADLVCCSICS